MRSFCTSLRTRASNIDPVHETEAGFEHEVCVRDARPDRSGGLYESNVFAICVSLYYNNITTPLQPLARDDRGDSKVFMRSMSQRGSGFVRRDVTAGNQRDTRFIRLYRKKIHDASVRDRRTPLSSIKSLSLLVAGCHFRFDLFFRIRTRARSGRATLSKYDLPYIGHVHLRLVACTEPVNPYTTTQDASRIRR